MSWIKTFIDWKKKHNNLYVNRTERMQYFVICSLRGVLNFNEVTKKACFSERAFSNTYRQTLYLTLKLSKKHLSTVHQNVGIRGIYL